MKLFYVMGGIRRGRYKYGFTPFTLNTMYRTRQTHYEGWVVGVVPDTGLQVLVLDIHGFIF